MRNRSKTIIQPPTTPGRIVALISLGLCTIIGSVVLMNAETPPGAAVGDPRRRAEIAGKLENRPFVNSVVNAAKPSSTPPTMESPGKPVSVTETKDGALSVKNLLIPVAGVAAGQLHDSFYDSRSEGRIHKALDIMAPRDTPVLATDDGRVLKLHQSERGGISLYQSDSSGNYVYFYGHLTRYAEGISEGKPVRRGELIAFVGDTGNAGAGNCHLHFGISRVTEAGRWSGGEPINPYPLLSGNPGKTSIEPSR